MALIHPSDHRSPAGQQETTTKHPMICLAGGFAFIVGAALLVHMVFGVLL